MSAAHGRPHIGRIVWVWRRYRRTIGGKTGFWEQCRVENAGRAVSGVRSRYGYLLQVPNEELFDEPVTDFIGKSG